MKLKAGKKSKKVLYDFLEEIKSMTAGKNWQIPFTMPLEYFQIPPEDFYRYLYSIQETECETFHQGNIETLMNLLKVCGVKEIEEIFFKGGYYFSEDYIIAFQELFHSVSLTKMQNHAIDRELLETSLSACRNPADGFSFYCDSVFDMNLLVDFAIEIFFEKYSLDDNEIGKSILKEHIASQFRLGIMVREDILSGLKENLKNKAVLWSFLSADDCRSRYTDEKISYEMQAALRTLEFSGNSMPDESSLKERYRDLVKKFHPDINPEGLEKTRKINSAYSLVVQYTIMRRAG